MTTSSLKKRINVAAKREKADLVIKNARIVNVFSHTIETADIAVVDGVIAGIGSFDGETIVDADGLFALPGLIDSHIHIESSFLTPEQFGRMCICHGTTTAVCDPHEIANVCGTAGLDYMIAAAQHAPMDILYMVPSCVPCTEFEDSGARLDAEQMRPYLKNEKVRGVAELMNAVGVLGLEENVIEKIVMAKNEGALIDGHSPGVGDDVLSAYLAAGIATDHEAGTVDEMLSRIKGGMYVQLRYGSACRELPTLLKGLTKENARRCLLCSDDRQSLDFLRRGSIDDLLRVCVKNGVDPITAVTMATLNAAECYHLSDRGALAPGRRADVVLVDDLTRFDAKKVFLSGELVAEDGVCLKEIARVDPGAVGESMHIKDFSEEKLRMCLSSNHVRVIDLFPETVLTEEGDAFIRLDDENDFLFDSEIGVARISCIERHHETGKVANAFLRGYGIKKGAIALTVGHDSHNVLTVGVSRREMAAAVSALIRQKGGVVVVENGEVLASLPLPVAGLMSDRTAEEVARSLQQIETVAVERLGVNPDVDVLVTLCFMSLPVIPDLKLTDRGLFDVKRQRFVPVELGDDDDP